MGVITTASISSGTLIGPIPTTLTLTDPAYLIGHMTCDNRPDVHTVKLDLNEYCDGSRAGEWLPYVQAARDRTEQNLEATLSASGKLHYRALRNIRCDEELLVWYDEDMAARLGVPDIKSYYVKDGCLYCCPACDQTFRFPFSLRAHMRFRCDHRLSSAANKTDSATPKHSPRTASKNSLYNPYHGVIKCNTISPSDPRGSVVPSPTSSISPGTNSNGSCSPPCGDSTTNSHSASTIGKNNAADVKPRYSESDSSSSETTFSSPLNLKRTQHSRRSSEDDVAMSKRHKADQNQNFPEVPGAGKSDEGNSAFRKVEKPSLASPSARLEPSYPIGTTATTSLLASTHTMMAARAMFSEKNLMAQQHQQNLMSKFRAMLPPGGLPAAYLPGYRSTGPASENLPLNLADVYGAQMKLDGYPDNTHNNFDPRSRMKHPTTTSGPDTLMDIRNLALPRSSPTVLPPPPPGLRDRMTSPAVSGGFINPAAAAQMRNPLQFYRSPNPMVDKLLTSATNPMSAGAFSPLSPSSLTQNWCAKCNATFRMTSDLVYHMRSHHKSTTAVKVNKKEDKLKCTICSETFRERHHLTRHMSSHA